MSGLKSHYLTGERYLVAESGGAILLNIHDLPAISISRPLARTLVTELQKALTPSKHKALFVSASWFGPNASWNRCPNGHDEYVWIRREAETSPERYETDGFHICMVCRAVWSIAKKGSADAKP